MENLELSREGREENGANFEVSLNDDPDDLAAFTARALVKQMRRDNIASKERDSVEAPRYKQERKELERKMGKIGTSKLALREKESDYQAVKAEMAANDGELFRNPAEVVKQYEPLFQFLGESEKFDPEIEQNYARITGKKERLKFFSNASLANKVKLLGGKNFDERSYDRFVETLDYYQRMLGYERPSDSVDGQWDDDDNYDDDDDGYDPYDARLDDSSSDELSRGLLRDSLRAAMTGTPEYGAYKMALDIAESRAIKIPAGFPYTRGYYSDIYANGQIGYWSSIIDGYDMVASRVAKKHPELKGAELEHYTVRRAANIYVESMEYNDRSRGEASPYVSGFCESVAWAQLGEEVKAQFRGMRHKIESVDLSNIERFIGKSGNSKKRESLEMERFKLGKRLEYMDSLSNEGKAEFLAKENAFEIKKQEEWREKETARIEHKYQKLIDKTRSEERRVILAGRRDEELGQVAGDVSGKIAYFQDREFDGLRTDIDERRSELEQKINKRKSLAEKAIDLHFYAGKGQDWGCSLDWINEVPFGVIKDAHRAMSEGESVEAVQKRAVAGMLRRIAPEKSDEEFVELFESRDWGSREMSAMVKALYPRSDHRNAFEFSDLISDVGLEEARKVFLEEKNWRDLHDVMATLRERGVSDGELFGRAREICRVDWLGNSVEASIEDYPFEKNDNAKYNWCFKNSVVGLGPDWGAQTIGKILYTRLTNGVESSIHNASMWLTTFETPAIGYDIARLKADKASGKYTGNLDDYLIGLKNSELEGEFLFDIVNASSEDRQKLRLPGKDQKIGWLFNSPEYFFVYKELFKVYRDDADPLERLESLNQEDIIAFYNQMVASSDKLHGVKEEDFVMSVREVLQWFHMRRARRDGSRPPREISAMLSRLGSYGENRKKYIDDTSRWLTRHMTTPHELLQKAWGSRAKALAEGIEDRASEVEGWSKSRALAEQVGDILDKYRGGTGLMERDFVNGGKYERFTRELIRDYDTKTAVRAVVRYHEIHNPEKICPAAEYKLKHARGEYVGTVLAHDDPRGMTIGYDTGCCMTVDGASRSCIESGYRDKTAGFFALYEGNGRIVAQSYFYTNPENPEVLVMDNIESNAGRNADTIVDLYGDFFKQYFAEQFKNNPDWQIREVHIGTQYGELVKPIVKRLPEAEIVWNPDWEVYTDASRDQRLLFRMTDEEIRAARTSNENAPETSELAPTHQTFENTSPLDVDRVELLRDLEATIYPENMRQYDDIDFAMSELSMPGVDKYSFIIDAQTDAEKVPVGYCLAYEAESESEPGFAGKCLYIADFAVAPGGRSGNTAMKGFRELLSRARRDGMEKIEMEARESTSYALFTNPLVQRILAGEGFRVVEHGEGDTFGENERTIWLSLEPIA